MYADQPDPAPGMLLIAEPMMHDSTFHRTVVLLCDHGPEGSFGLVLNRPIELALPDVLGGLGTDDHVLSLGGPVQTDTLHYLHRYGDGLVDARPVAKEVAWGGDFEVLRSMLDRQQADAADVRFFMGYSGWGPGQLEQEIAQDGWIRTPAVAEDIFGDPTSLWRRVLRRMGGDYAMLSNFPDDPRMN